MTTNLSFPPASPTNYNTYTEIDINEKVQTGGQPSTVEKTSNLVTNDPRRGVVDNCSCRCCGCDFRLCCECPEHHCCCGICKFKCTIM